MYHLGLVCYTAGTLFSRLNSQRRRPKGRPVLGRRSSGIDHTATVHPHSRRAASFGARRYQVIVRSSDGGIDRIVERKSAANEKAGEDGEEKEDNDDFADVDGDYSYAGHAEL